MSEEAVRCKRCCTKRQRPTKTVAGDLILDTDKVDPKNWLCFKCFKEELKNSQARLF